MKENVNNPIYINIFLLGIIVWCIGFIAFVVIRAIKAEKIAKIFRKSIKVGDGVFWDTRLHSKGEVVDIDPMGDGKFIKVTTVVPKHIIYPQ